MSEGERATALEVLAIVADGATGELLKHAIRDAGHDDVVNLVADLQEGLARAANEAPDLVFVDLSLGRRGALAVVHHLRAVCPRARIQVLAVAESLELAMQAVSLGAGGFTLLPASGDDFATIASDVRVRLAEAVQREKLAQRLEETTVGVDLLCRLTEFGDVTGRRAAAERLASVTSELLGTADVAVFLAARGGPLNRVAAHGKLAGAPSMGTELEVLSIASMFELDVIPLTVGSESSGLLLVGRSPAVRGLGRIADVLGAFAATQLALLAEREAGERGAIKDPDSSAYTFAYFVDVAGREIDRARRHKRSFSLATVASESVRASARTELVDRILSATRDTDVLARIDAHEFYLLLPETGGAGAHACRRRITRRMVDLVGGSEVSIGVATFPQDGRDLSRLLRLARHRADVSSETRRFLELHGGGTLAATLDAVLAGRNVPATLRTVDLRPSALADVALSAVREARRGGATTVVATQRGASSLASAIRVAVGRDRDDVRYRPVDVSRVVGCEALDALTVVAEHGTYALLTRAGPDLIRAVHTSDPAFADYVDTRLGEASGLRLMD